MSLKGMRVLLSITIFLFVCVNCLNFGKGIKFPVI